MHYNLNQRFTLEDRRNHPDGSGGYHTNWVPIGQIWVQITAQIAQEHLGEDEQHTTHRVEMVTRNAAIGSDARPKVGQRLCTNTICYQISSVAELPKSPLYLKLIATSDHQL